MGQPFLGQIIMFGGTFAIAGWAFCNGQLVPIDQNPALYNLIGTTYGGDGVTTFALPNLQSRVAIHQGTGQGLSTYVIGQACRHRKRHAEHAANPGAQPWLLGVRHDCYFGRPNSYRQHVAGQAEPDLDRLPLCGR